MTNPAPPQEPEGAPRARQEAPRTRFWIEIVLVLLATILAIATAVAPDWIERLTGTEPDAGHGELEWLLAFIPGVVAVGLGLFARREWRRTVPA